MTAQTTNVRIYASDATTLTVAPSESTGLSVRAGDSSLISVSGNTSTTVSISNAQSTAVSVVNAQSTAVTYRNAEATVLQAAPATINLGASVQLSSDAPLELSNTGSAGTSLLASRADHRHPSTGMFLNGGNF